MINVLEMPSVAGMFLAAFSVLVCMVSKSSEVQKWLLGATVAVFGYFLGNFWCVQADDVPDFYFSHKIIYVCTMLMGLFLVYALAELCEVKLSKRLRLFAAVAMAVCIGVALMLDMDNGWYLGVTWQEYELYPGYLDFDSTNGWTFYVINVVMLGALAVVAAYLIYRIVKKKGKKIKAIRTILILLLTPAFTFLVSELGILSTRVSNHVMIFGLDLAIMILQIRYDIMTTVPVAKDRALDSTTDGIVILNHHNDFLYANKIVKESFPAPDWENADEAGAYVASAFGETQYMEQGGQEYELRREPVLDGDRERAQILWIINVTEQVQRIREQEKSKRATETLRQAITSLAASIDAKDTYTNGHSARVAKYTRMLAERVGITGDALDDAYDIAMMHDVGKIGIPDAIINKTSRLTDEEFAVIKTHPVIGSNILSGITSFPELQTGARWHHERYDGKGYPDGLAGEKIPYIARIISIADSYDAMTSCRSYRDALPQDVVRSEIEKNKGTQFEPELAEVWLSIMDEDTDYQLCEKRGESA